MSLSPHADLQGRHTIRGEIRFSAAHLHLGFLNSLEPLSSGSTLVSSSSELHICCLQVGVKKACKAILGASPIVYCGHGS